ncbi:GGDEF domain-containing protein [Niveibacterium terrae]|uniref:GGDEF domain-containing protein n=1 Tax=Niveibacterium terrae TaxID=3373598 RepID=UPI003A91B60A
MFSDLSLVLFVTSAIALTLGLGMLFVRRSFSQAFADIAPLAWASLCFGFCCAAFAANQKSDSAVTLWLLLGVFFAHACAAFFHLTLCMLFERRFHVGRLVLAAALAWLAGLGFVFWLPNAFWCFISFGSGLLLMQALSLVEIFRHWRARRNLGSRLMLILTAILALAIALRLGLGAWNWRGVDETVWRFSVEAILFAVVASAFISLLLICTVLISQRALVQLRATSAREDILTRLANRSAIVDILDDELDRCGLSDSPLSLLLIEIDNYRQFCDWYGSALGDRVLVHVAQSLQGRLRPGDRIGRWGEASFLIVLPGSGAKYALHCARSLVHNLRYYGFQVGSLALDLSVCSGLATSRCSETRREALISEAEKSLQLACGRIDGLGPLIELD